MKVQDFTVGDVVEVKSFGYWYAGTVTKLGRTRVSVRYTTGTGTTRDKAFPLDRVRFPTEATEPSQDVAALNVEISEQTARAFNSHLDIPTGPIRLKTIRQGLKLEIKVPGMRLTGKAPKCSTILRKEFGLKGTPRRLLFQLEACMVKTGLLDITQMTDDLELKR